MTLGQENAVFDFRQPVDFGHSFLSVPQSIPQLYKCRWQVELFFKWIKQHLRIKAFFGATENAVKTRVWIAVSVSTRCHHQEGAENRSQSERNPANSQHYAFRENRYLPSDYNYNHPKQQSSKSQPVDFIRLLAGQQ